LFLRIVLKLKSEEKYNNKTLREVKRESVVAASVGYRRERPLANNATGCWKRRRRRRRRRKKKNSNPNQKREREKPL
jgi:hypothetical protein